jgi:hypothetical protein
MSPPVFVSYRRADEPFAAALIYAVLAERWPGDPVFLDTRFLKQRGDVARPLLDAVAASELVLAVIGPVWDDAARRERLADTDDWVRRELIAAADAGKRVVPLLVDRPGVPTDLPFAPPRWDVPIHVASADFWRSVEVLRQRVEAVLGPPGRNRTPRELMLPAVDAMLRHVLPPAQRRMRNDEMVARVAADELGDREWLRFVATANLPDRPNGSAVVWLTSELLGVADLGSDFRPRTAPRRIRHAELRAVDRVDRSRLWKPVSDLRLTLRTGAALDLHGFFAEEADELLEVLQRLRRVGDVRR